MSKSITSENLEMILQRVLEKNNDSLNDTLQKMTANSEMLMQKMLEKNNEMFERILDKMADTTNKIIQSALQSFSTAMKDITKVIVESLDNVMDKCTSRLEGLETKVGELNGKLESTTLPASAVPVESVSEAIWRLEEEREERRKKEKNVIISGLPKNPQLSDKELVADFCDKHLTAKPTIMKTRRLHPGNPVSKICVTLASTIEVDDVIQSSILLRSSPDQAIKNIFINHDLTKQQAETEFKKRCERREKRGVVASKPSTPSSSKLPFRG